MTQCRIINSMIRRIYQSNPAKLSLKVLILIFFRLRQRIIQLYKVLSTILRSQLFHRAHQLFLSKEDSDVSKSFEKFDHVELFLDSHRALTIESVEFVLINSPAKTWFECVHEEDLECLTKIKLYDSIVWYFYSLRVV